MVTIEALQVHVAHTLGNALTNVRRAGFKAVIAGSFIRMPRSTSYNKQWLLGHIRCSVCNASRNDIGKRVPGTVLQMNTEECRCPPPCNSGNDLHLHEPLQTLVCVPDQENCAAPHYGWLNAEEWVGSLTQRLSEGMEVQGCFT